VNQHAIALGQKPQRSQVYVTEADLASGRQALEQPQGKQPTVAAAGLIKVGGQGASRQLRQYGIWRSGVGIVGEDQDG
jgi:hypothetical protein